MLQNLGYRRIFPLFILFAFLLSVSLSAMSADPAIWTTNSRVDLLKGDARGVSITDTGAVTLAPRVDQVYNTDQAYVWSSAIDASGNIYLGTGHDGKIYKIGSDGRGTLLYDAPELDVTALAIGHDGSIFAGTSPDGKVYRIGTDGHAEVYFDPADKYIWSLAVMKDGSLAIGTGDSGKLYRVTGKDAKPEASLLVDTAETHVISLAVDAEGNLIAGTDPGGIVLRISPQGKTFALFDSSLREIHAIAPAPDGSIYALGLSDSAGGPKVSSSSSSPSSTPGSEGSGGGTVTTTITMTSGDDSGGAAGQAGQPARSREDLSTARSAVFRILPDGGTDVIWSSSTVTAFSIVPDPSGTGVLIGTADKGRIYSVTNDGRDTLLLQTTEGQISVLTAKGNDVYAASSNQGKLFRFGSGLVNEGTFESSVKDAKLVSSWGRIWWRGQGKVELQTRAGNTERPDATWSDWSTTYTDPKGAQISSPRTRFIQWRATLRSVGTGTAAQAPKMEGVNLAFLTRNVAPEVLSITFLPTGVGLQPAIGVQVDPNIETSGLDPSLFGVQTQLPPRRVYQRGAKSIQWQADDRNGDTLEYSLYYRSLNETQFRLLKDKIRETFYTIDGSTLADGRYIFKVVASDGLDNPPGQALVGEKISEPVDLDNTPPEVRVVGQPQVSGDRLRVTFEAIDGTGMVKRADISVDGGPWSGVLPEDGIADSPREVYPVDATISGPGEHSISIRVYDASGNVGSTRVAVRK
jgi:sugar lactone lactonase YvrE